jgi:hypothetical protein
MPVDTLHVPPLLQMSTQLPHVTVTWQLSRPVPHAPFVQHVFVVGSHSPVQLSHETVWPQLFTRDAPLHAPAHVVAIGSGVQHVVPSQTWPELHDAGQPMVCPQLLTTFSLHLPAQAAALFGVQHVSFAKQTSPAVAQFAVPPEPQKTV